MNYELKDKILPTQEFLQELEVRGWQEIEHLQTQIANLAEDTVSNKIRQLLTNLLTSYYVFTGGVEVLANAKTDDTIETAVKVQIEDPVIDAMKDEPEIANAGYVMDDNDSIEDAIADNNCDTEPFEYFVDFDDPIGEPLTDKDLYNN